jgi:1,2-phenylacetyl-CoA epoxidase catalytic subunit
MSRSLEPWSIEASEIRCGRVDPYYVKTLTRVLAAHAMTQKLVVAGYQRMLDTVADPSLRELTEQIHLQERLHAQLVYQLLEEIGVREQSADRTLLRAFRSPSFEAPLFFAERAQGEIDLLMAGLSFETSGLLMLGVNYVESSYAPHARLAQVVLEEKAAHDQLFSDLLAQEAPRLGLELVSERLFCWLPMAVNSFGPAGSGFTNECLRLGLKRKDNQQLADLYLALTRLRCQRVGLRMPQLTAEYPRRLV